MVGTSWLFFFYRKKNMKSKVLSTSFAQSLNFYSRCMENNIHAITMSLGVLVSLIFVLAKPEYTMQL